MKTEDIGVKVTVLEGLAYVVPGTVFIWVLVQIEAQMVAYLPAGWPVTSLDTAMAGALVILSGVALQEAGHIFKWPYDKIYKPWRRRHGDPAKAAFDQEVAALAGDIGQPYHHAKAQLVNAGRPVERVLLLEGISKMFRAMALGCLVLVVWYGVTETVLGAGLAILGMLAAFLVHARFRFASTQELYLAFVQWRGEQKTET